MNYKIISTILNKLYAMKVIKEKENLVKALVITIVVALLSFVTKAFLGENVFLNVLILPVSLLFGANIAMKTKANKEILNPSKYHLEIDFVNEDDYASGTNKNINVLKNAFISFEVGYIASHLMMALVTIQAILSKDLLDIGVSSVLAIFVFILNTRTSLFDKIFKTNIFVVIDLVVASIIGIGLRFLGIQNAVNPLITMISVAIMLISIMVYKTKLNVLIVDEIPNNGLAYKSVASIMGKEISFIKKDEMVSLVTSLKEVKEEEQKEQLDIVKNGDKKSQEFIEDAKRKGLYEAYCRLGRIIDPNIPVSMNFKDFKKLYPKEYELCMNNLKSKNLSTSQKKNKIVEHFEKENIQISKEEANELLENMMNGVDVSDQLAGYSGANGKGVVNRFKNRNR